MSRFFSFPLAPSRQLLCFQLQRVTMTVDPMQHSLSVGNPRLDGKFKHKCNMSTFSTKVLFQGMG